MRLRRLPIHCAMLTVVAFAAAPFARGQQAPSAIGITVPSIATSFPQNADASGNRKWLYDHGVSYNFIYTNDVLSNLSGGIKRGTIDQGKLEAQLYIDLEKLAGLKSWTFYANAFGIYNDGRIRRDYVGGMNTIAAIEATPTVRLSELWLERWFGPLSFRFGQLAADAEFFYSDVSQIFMQSDWPTIGAVNLPGGGPAYPLSAVGARIKYELPKDASLLFAIFNGDPAPPCGNADPDTCNRYGLNFRLSDPAFMIGEFQWRRNRGKHDTGLATTLKIGGWSHLGQFADKQFTNNGMLLANPASNGMPLMHRGDYGIYGVIDQQLYRPPGGDGNSGISVFNRSAISPSDRNLVNVEIDGGIVFAGMIPKRPDDSFGASVIYSRFSNSIRAFDQEQINFGTLSTPPRDYEINLELTYVAEIIKGWVVQPVYTYIWHPSGTGIRYPDAHVAGVRTIIRY
ncbi:MAG TPA: carbohydrate porin [Pseudolabrys sp.]|nr:carbohydrate porin [Pseudolabrys sp.]